MKEMRFKMALKLIEFGSGLEFFFISIMTP